MSDPLWGIKLKLERAFFQLRSLRSQIEEYGKRRPHAMAVDLDENARLITLRLQVREECPGTWGIIIGEIVHNLRSALDHLVWQLVILETNQPPVKPDETQFPIEVEEKNFDGKAPRLLRDLSKATTSLIKSMQPFSTGEGSTSPLVHLRKLSNFDKHRTIHLTGGSLVDFKLLIPITAAGTLGGEDLKDRGQGYSGTGQCCSE